MPLRVRTLVLWLVFLAAAAIGGIAVHRLYVRTQTELLAQSDRAVAQARAAATQRIDAYLVATRRTLLLELAGFHEDGLRNALQRWDTANNLVNGTLVGEAQQASAPTEFAVIAETIREFRSWRAAHAAAVVRPPDQGGRDEVVAFRTLGNPAVPTEGLRYQEENLDLLRDAGRVVDPWAGWTAAANGCVLWYQAGPDAPVRGCFVPSLPLVENVRPQLDEGELARIQLVGLAAEGSGGTTWDSTMKSPPVRPLPYPGLPGFALVVEPGELLRQKAADTRFDALIAATLIGLFVLGAGALTLHTWRAARDAGRRITFVTQVSHELRTPLTSIRMFADMLAEPEVTEEKRRKFAGTIGRESARLGELIERLLAFNALERGQRKVAAAPFEIGALVREVADDTAAKLAAAGLHAALALPAEPLRALGERNLVKQALLNLLDNACKYAPGSGTVDLAVATTDGRVVVRVADRGPGVPAAISDRLFEPFVQGGQDLTDKSPGIGLGLSLARGLLRQAGGDVVAISAPTGATFEIHLPLAP
jgi:signal transduction histidine kinase